MARKLAAAALVIVGLWCLWVGVVASAELMWSVDAVAPPELSWPSSFTVDLAAQIYRASADPAAAPSPAKIANTWRLLAGTFAVFGLGLLVGGAFVAIPKRERAG